MKYLLQFFLILAFLLVVIPKEIHAQEDWQIENFNSNITLLQNGIVQVTETISVDFGPLSKHGIFRDIPYIYTGDDGTKTYTKIEVQSINRNNETEKYKVSKNGDFIDIKIGDPDKTISGAQSYQISYLATGVLRSYDTYDEFYWNATGNNWEVPIISSKAQVNLPESKIEKISCFKGSIGSTENCLSSSSRPTASFSNPQPIAPGEGLTIVIAYKKGLFPILTVDAPETFEKQLTKPLPVFLSLAVLLGGAGTIFYLWYTRGRDFWFRRKDLFDPNSKEETKPIGAHETIVVEYSPPENLRPAELGTLIDQRADTLDVTATIIDLAVRGYLTIKEETKNWLFGKTDYTLTRTKKTAEGLLPYESYLINEIFKSSDAITISSLKKTFYDELAEVKTKLYEHVVTKKLFAKNPDSIRTRYVVLAIFMVIAGLVLFFVGLGNENALISAFGTPLAINGVLLLIFGNFMPRRSAYGHDLYKKAKGYELFIAKAEAHRQKFFENKNLFNEVLPYAITFGLVEKFAQAMKDIGLKPTAAATGWYYGTHPFAPDTFASNVNSFSNTFSNAIAQTPSKGGGFSGGSSSGGFGGGGGGSW